MDGTYRGKTGVVLLLLGGHFIDVCGSARRHWTELGQGTALRNFSTTNGGRLPAWILLTQFFNSLSGHNTQKQLNYKAQEEKLYTFLFLFSARCDDDDSADGWLAFCLWLLLGAGIGMGFTRRLAGNDGQTTTFIYDF